MFALFWMPVGGAGEEGVLLSKRQGLHNRSDSHLEIGHWWSDQHKLNYYYLASSDYWFLHFLISLIKLVLWLKFFQGRQRTWGTRTI